MPKLRRVLPLLFLAGALPALAATDVRVIISTDVAPGVYGRVDLGGGPPPPLLYATPMVIERHAAPAQPIYLHVPPGHVKHWSKHCAKYNACGVPVYFVRSDEYEPKRRGKKDKH
jgi:hypothetical protein